MAVEGVTCEPFSGQVFPANREKYREFSQIWPSILASLSAILLKIDCLHPSISHSEETEQGIITCISGKHISLIYGFQSLRSLGYLPKGSMNASRTPVERESHLSEKATIQPFAFVSNFGDRFGDLV